MLNELKLAVERAVYAAVSVAVASNLVSLHQAKEWEAVGISAGIAALISFLNSVKTYLGNVSS